MIEQAARAEAERRYPNNTHTRSTPFYAAMKREAFEAGASWLASHLLSDESVERVKKALREQGLDDNGLSPHGWRCEHPDRFPDYCTCVDDVARAALSAVLGKA